MTPVCVRPSFLEIGRWKTNIIYRKKKPQITYERTWILKDSDAGILHLSCTSSMHCLAFQTLGSCPFSSYKSGNEHSFWNNMFHSRWWIECITPAVPTWNISWQPNFHYRSISVNYSPCTMHYKSIYEPFSVSVICWPQDWHSAHRMVSRVKLQYLFSILT